MLYNCIIIGGGIVGLATAYQLLDVHPTWKVLLLEKESGLARHQTGNNSGVIHAGVYYTPGSLKARLTVDGGRELVAFCRDNNVAIDICGKLILATSDQELPRLRLLADRAKVNGLEGARIIGSDEIRRFEPNARGPEALHVPTTGIVDFVGVCEALAHRIRSANGEIHLNESLTGIRDGRQLIVVTAQSEYQAERMVTCAGLHSDRVAMMNTEDLPVRIIPFRGEYHRVKRDRSDIVRALLYPVPDPRFPFAGVHFTRLLDRGLEVGPNAVLALKREGYSWSDISFPDVWETISWPGFQSLAANHWRYGLDEMYRSFSKRAFTRELQKMVPDIAEADLEPGGAGVRAQACHKDGTLVNDFFFVRKGRVLHVCNAPSPAATASLAIGRYIAEELEK